MKSFKDVKARFKVGQEITATNHVRPESSGRRTVTKVQTNGYWFWMANDAAEPAMRRRFWFAFPSKAAQCRIDGPDEATFLDIDGVALVTIDFGPVTP